MYPACVSERSTLAPGRIPVNMGWKNLQRGKRRVPPPGTGNIEAIQRAREADKAMGDLARNDPERVQEELYAELSTAALRLTRKLNRAGGEPSRLLLEAWREVRQAGLVVLEIRKARGTAAEAEEFFADLDNRVDSLLQFSEGEMGELRPLMELDDSDAREEDHSVVQAREDAPAGTETEAEDDAGHADDPSD